MIILDIAHYEIRRLFMSPIAWILLALLQFLLAIFFYVILNQYLEASHLYQGRGITEIVTSGMLQIAGLIMLLVTPFLTMRLFSDDFRAGTIKLLLSSPVSITEMVIGKYLGIVLFLLCLTSIISLMPLSLLLGTKLDISLWFCGTLAFILLTLSFAAIGLFVSTLTRHAAAAAISAFGVSFLLWIVHVVGNSGGEKVAAISNYLSIQIHFNQLLAGRFSSTDIVYFLLIICVFLLLGIWRLDAMRTHQ